MTSSDKSLTTFITSELMNISCALGELKVQDQWQVARITALEQRLDSKICSSPKRPESIATGTEPTRRTLGQRLRGGIETLLLIYNVVRTIPWGLITMFAVMSWKWIMPVLSRWAGWL